MIQNEPCRHKVLLWHCATCLLEIAETARKENERRMDILSRSEAHVVRLAARIAELEARLAEAKKENERLRHPSCVPYAGAEVVCKERDALRTQVAELKSRLADAKRENERLTIERNYWYGATAAAIEQKKALGPLPAAPNEAGK